MSANWFRRTVEDMLARADIRIGGDRPWDIQVHREALFKWVLRKGSLGLGEAYMEGWWDCSLLDEFFCRILTAQLDTRIHPLADWGHALVALLFNVQRLSRAFHIGSHHYDLGNDFYRAMLGESMMYSCACWENANTLEEAQEAKLEKIGRKLDLQPGMNVLDIGCGWGAAARFFAERYGVSVTGITVSREQAQFARQLCDSLPVEIRYEDYRSLSGQFDAIFSIGMFEHVGYKNYSRFMDVVRKCLKPDGRFLLHTIGSNESSRWGDPWIEKYIFPNSMLPSAAQIARAMEGKFILEDWENFGPDYDHTLMAWYRNFQEAWPRFKEQYPDTFYRMWSYYLLSCAGIFRARKKQVWQLLLSPRGIPGGYRRS